jgi:predicted transcriptional regulator
LKKGNWPYEARRDHLQILEDILELCKTPTPKTQILHTVNTNFKLLEAYLLQLKAAELIEKNTTSCKYSTTKKGLIFIKHWKVLQTIMKPKQIASTVQTKKQVVNNKQIIVVSK